MFHTSISTMVGESCKMNKITLSTLTFSTALAVLACERKTIVVEIPAPTPTPILEPVAKTKTLETSRLGTAVDTYLRTPSAENSADVKKAVADLDGEIAELETHVANGTGGERGEAAAKLKNLRAFRTAEVARFTAGQVVTPLTPPVSGDARTGAEKVEDAAKRTGKTIENAAEKVGDAIKDVVR